MKIFNPIVFSLSIIISQISIGQTLSKLWETDTITTTPESVLYDPSEKVLYAACINGRPSAENNQSFIAKLSIDGKIINLKFTDGLNSTKGMGILAGKLYVTEMFKIVEIDLKTENILKKYEVPEAKFLNDISVDAKGGVIYFSDMGTSTMWALKNGELTKLIAGEPLKSPNGVFYENESLLIGNSDGILYRYYLKNKSFSKVAEGMGGIDGITPDGKGNYLASEWRGKVWFVKDDGSIKELINSVDAKINTADIDFLKDKNVLFVPTFFHNTVAAYQMTK